MTNKQGFLATFRIDEKLWGDFRNIAKNNQTNASALLIGYIESVVAAGDTPKNNSASPQPCLDKNIDDAVKKLIADSLEDGIVGEAIAKVQRKLADENNELQRQLYVLEESLEQLKSEMLSKIDNISEKTSITPSQQSPVTSHQSPVTSHQSPITEPAQIERSLVENIRTTLKRKGISATTEQIRAAFFAAGWDGANYQEIRKDILEILSGAMP